MLVIQREGNMANQYKQTSLIRFVNQIAILTMKIGIAPKYQYLLCVKGRKSGRIYSTPVYLVEEEGKRWLVSPYGDVAWVLNARVAGQITLTQNTKSQSFIIKELSGAESAPILKKYLALAPITQNYFDAKPDAPVETFLLEASRHPVFELTLMKTKDK
jgi:deazaflavin-dependent oxidoreductase (nitroreductase family)